MNWQRLLFPAAIIACVGAAQAADEMVTLNFVNADIDTVVKAVGKITRRNFLIDPRVKGTVNIVSGHPIPAALTYQVLLAALRLQGFTAVDTNGVTLILPEADAKLHGGGVTAGESKSRGNEMTTEVFTLKYGSAAQLLPIIRPLVAPNNPVTTYPGSNAVVVTDYADNLRRIAQIIESIDQPSADEPVLVPVQHLPAAEMAGIITRMLNDSPKTNADADQRVTVIPDQRSNSLVIRSQNPARVTSIRALIERLDKRETTPGNIHVVYLRNAEATKLAQTLRSIVTGESSAVSSAAANPAASAGGAVSGTAAGMATGAEMAGGSGFIQADAASNALIITAPDAVFENLRSVITSLDVRRAQVHIEALIAEVTSDKLNELGIQWQGVTASGRSAIVAGTNFNAGGNNILGITAAAAGASSGSGSAGLSLPGSGLNVGVVNRINLPGGGQILNLSMLARALQTDGTTNILSTPNLLTLDNEEANIVVGQNVPFITGQYAQTGSSVTATPFQTIERRDVGLTLKVKPQITEGGTVRLRVAQEVSSVDSTTNTAGIITNKRALDSTVLLGDGQTVVLGGLIQDSVTDGAEKVPLLGDIPVLGALFTYSKKRRTKTNLMVFLRPTIIRDANIPDRLTQDRYNFIIGGQLLDPDSAAKLPGFSLAPAPATAPATSPASK